MRSPTPVKPLMLATALLIRLRIASCGSSTGHRLYRHGGCVKCHGVQLKGSHLGPSLRGLKQRWSSEDLDRFLRSPLGYKETNPRLKELAKRYPAPMLAFTMTNSDRTDLVGFLMEASRE